jgi:polar amino acid transport system substrate-binding protein
MDAERKKQMRVGTAHFFRTFVFFIVAACLAACASASRPVIEASPDILRVGVCANSPPVIFRHDDGTYAGIEADLARELAASLEKTVYFVECDWNDLIPALLENRIDIIMSGMTVTSSRSVRVAFTEPYLRSGQVGLTTNAHALRIRGVNSLLNPALRVGMEKGTTGEIISEKFLTSAKKVAYKEPVQGVRAVLKGRIDLFIHDAPVVWWFASLYESQGLTALPFFISEEDIAWAVRKDDSALQAGANRFITARQQDGQLRALLRRWLPKI